MFDELKSTMSPERFQEYVRVQNPEFQTLNRIAQQENIPADSVQRAFSLRDKFAQESTRIVDDTSLSYDQKRAALKDLGQSARVQLIGTLGQTGGTAYAQAARWVSTIENGGGVTIGVDGQVTSRNLPRIPPPAKK
jgi:hypothetical protein